MPDDSLLYEVGFYGTNRWRGVFEVDFGANIDRNGWITWPAEREHWACECTLLAPRAGERVLRDHPLARQAIEVARAACADYAVAVVDERKKGSSVIGITFAVKDGVVVQIYVLQKKMWYVLKFDYAGTPRLVPLVEVIFNADEVYSVNLEIVAGDDSFKAEAAAWWSVVMMLGADRAELCMQMPMGRMPLFGLSPALEKAIRALLRKFPRHKAKQILTAKAGAPIPLHVRKIGKMDPIAAAAHRDDVNEGLRRHGHGPIGAEDGPGFETRFGGSRGQEGRGPGGVDTRFGGSRGNDAAGVETQFGGSRGNDAAGVETQLCEDWDELDPDVLATRYRRTYFLLLNAGLHCAATGERPPSWTSRTLTKTRLANGALKTLEFQDTLGGTGPDADRLQTLRIVDVRDTGGTGHTQRRFVVDIQAEDGTVATWAAYDACVALKLIGPTTRPPEPPPARDDRAWKKKLKPWPEFSRRRRSKRVRL